MTHARLSAGFFGTSKVAFVMDMAMKMTHKFVFFEEKTHNSVFRSLASNSDCRRYANLLIYPLFSQIRNFGVRMVRNSEFGL